MSPAMMKKGKSIRIGMSLNRIGLAPQLREAHVPPIRCMDPPLPGLSDDRRRKVSQYATYWYLHTKYRPFGQISRQTPWDLVAVV